MIYSVRHTTTFRYEPAVRESVMEVRMQPRSEGNQRCLSFTLNVTPAANITQYFDFTGNIVHHFDIAGSHKEVKVKAQSTVQVESVPSPRASEAGDWADLDALTASDDYWEMMLPSQFAQSGEALEQLAKELKCQRRGNPLELLTELNEGIYKLFAYVPNSTKVDSPIEEALLTRKGVCQDFAQFQIACLRSLNLSARYVSGYLRTDPPPGQPRLIGADASHAWLSAYCPGLGWIDVDPTNNLVPSDGHVTLAWGRDYGDVSPLYGVIQGGGAHVLHVGVDMEAIEPSTPNT